MNEQTKRDSRTSPVLRCMNVKFSPNLGDGLLSECLETTLIAAGAAQATCSIDLAGRTEYGQTTLGRGAVLSILDKLPANLRHLAVRLPLKLQSHRKWRPHYEAKLGNADAMVIGGGNLLADLDLNFPTKIALAADVAKNHDLPLAIFGCGMGANWSRKGLSLVSEGLSNSSLKAVFLRDEASKKYWDEHFAPTTNQEAQVVRDPGLLASQVYGEPDRPSGQKKRIGLGIMSHVALRYHATTSISASTLSQWYVDLARSLKDAGFDVVAFTNGSPEDIADAQSIEAELGSLPDGGVPLLAPGTPRELAHIIAGCDAIAAYRMHAIIAAYSYGVPALALSWDKKLDSFMASVNQSAKLFDPAELAAEDASKLLQRYAQESLPSTEVEAILAEAAADVEKLLRVLS